MRTRPFLAGAALSLSLACAQTPPSLLQPDPDQVIARYRGGEIRRRDIAEALANQLARQPQPVSAEARVATVRKIVERRVRTAMLFEQARATGFVQRPGVLALARATEERVLAEDLLASETAHAAAADALVAAEADRRLQNAQPEEMRKFSHIYLRAPQKDAEARRRATARMDDIRRQLAAGASFNQLAESHSTSVMARGGGRIDWTRRAAMLPQIGDTVFSLAEGQVSDVLATADGLHLFRLDGIRAASPVDVDGIRKAVRQELDTEARAAAQRARRQQELDARGVELASAARLDSLVRNPPHGEPAQPGEWVARWSQGELRSDELLALRGRVAPPNQPVDVELRWLVENRLLAAARREHGVPAELSARAQAAADQAVIDAYRTLLMDQLATEPSEEAIARFHRENAAGALFLRDYRVDALYFPQTGDRLAEVYAAGEEVGTALRAGTAFDRLLDRPVRPEARLCRDVSASLEAIGRSSIRLRKALLNLAEGEVSAALYLDGPRTEIAPDRCVFDGRGVLFVRLRGIGSLSLAQASDAIRRALQDESVTAGVTVIQERLIAESGLEILAPEG